MAASRAAADRLEEARTAWAAAYHERERAVLEELAIVEDSRIEIVMGSRAQLLPERIAQPAGSMGPPALPPPEQLRQPAPPRAVAAAVVASIAAIIIGSALPQSTAAEVLLARPAPRTPTGRHPMRLRLRACTRSLRARRRLLL